MRKITFEEVLRRFRSIHGSKYAYDESTFSNTESKMRIECPIHGAFMQLVRGHLNGKGCSECGKQKQGRKRRLTTQEFVEKARRVHGDLYDYSRSDYIKAKVNIEIICREHGPYFQTPDNHTRGGKGCPVCGNRIPLTKSDFIARSRSVHGEEYDYSKVIFKTLNGDVDIICQEHGIFTQRANHHLRGSGCPRCVNKAPLNQEIFLEMAAAVHGETYDYSQSDYSGIHTKVEIICSEHGVFLQTPASHIHGGNGCPLCKCSGGEKEIEEYLIKRKVKYIREWRDHDCINQRVLPFDFYLPDLNCIVEFDGQHHFQPVRFSLSVTEDEALLSYKKVVHRDSLKDSWAQRNSIKMMRLSYTDRNEGKLIKMLEEFISSQEKQAGGGNQDGQQKRHSQEPGP